MYSYRKTKESHKDNGRIYLPLPGISVAFKHHLSHMACLPRRDWPNRQNETHHLFDVTMRQNTKNNGKTFNKTTMI